MEKPAFCPLRIIGDDSGVPSLSASRVEGGMFTAIVNPISRICTVPSRQPCDSEGTELKKYDKRLCIVLDLVPLEWKKISSHAL